ncbi:MAG TPA: hypothetical protein VGM92_04245, partial [Candidatus Kapabacteria bacterium]
MYSKFIFRNLIIVTFFVMGVSSCTKRTEETSADTMHTLMLVPAPHRAYPNASLTIVEPREGQILKQGDSVRVVMEVAGATLGVHTDADSTLGIAYSKQGQHVHVIVDNKPYMANYKNGQPFDIGVLPAGVHTIRAFPSFSWHESIKSPHAFATRTFYVGASKDTALANNLNGPLLTYSRPKGTYMGQEDSAVLLDFYVSNATLGDSSYKVNVWIDSTKMPAILTWQPYFIKGLSKGKHHIKLELVAPNGS